MKASLLGMTDAARRALVWWSSSITIVLLVAVLALGSMLRTGPAPLGIVSLQFATSPVEAAVILDSWRSVSRARLLWAHGLDLLLPVAYAFAIGAGAAQAAVAARRTERAAGVAIGTAMVAAVADQIENVAMGITLLAAPSWGSVLITLVAATVKSATLAIAVSALVLVVVARRDAARRPG